jgi:VCBS repeat-containing protein
MPVIRHEVDPFFTGVLAGFALDVVARVVDNDIESDEKSLSKKEAQERNFEIIFGDEKTTVAKFGSDTEWIEARGVDFAYDTSQGIVVTGGLIDTLIYRNEAGGVVTTITGFPPIDAAGFFSVADNASAAVLYELLTSLNDGDSIITGSDLSNGAAAGTGNDVATMGGGNDLIVKFDPGNLIYDGGDGSDSLSFQAEIGIGQPNPIVQQLVVILSIGTGQNPYGGTLSLTSVENVIGTSNPDTIIGSDDANIINDGIVETAGDIINALGGDDIVGFFSFAGFIPSLPGAQIDGGDGIDTLLFQYDQPGNVFDLTNQANNAGMFRASTITNIERFVVGDDFSTGFGSLTFVGDDEANYLKVNSGELTIDMGGGDDTLKLARAQTTDPVTADGGDGIDRLIFTAAAAVNVLDLQNPVNNTFPFANGTFTNFEIFELTIDSNPSLNFQLDFRGDATASTVIGGDDNDTFLGRSGSDTLMGGAGGDLYIHAPGDGNDTIVENGLAAVTGAIGESQTDTLRLVGLNPANVALTRAGNNLLVTLNGTGEVITVVDHFLGLAKGIEQIEFAGTAFNRQSIIDNLVGGTPNASPTVADLLVNVGLEDSGVQFVNLLTGASDPDGDAPHVANINGLGPGMTIVGDTLRVDRSDPGYQSFNGGGNRNFQVTYDVVDGNGGSVGQRATIAVTGVNDPAQIGGETTGSVTKDTSPAAAGFLSVSDPDINTITGVSQSIFQLQTDAPTNYGTFSLIHAKSGTWIYTLNNNHPDVQALTAGQSLTDIVPVQTLDGTTANVTVTIHGAAPPPNTPATIGGDQSGTVTEDTVLTATGTLTVTDPDAGEAAFQAGTIAGSHGSLALEADGDWTYTLNNAAAAVQALNTGQSLPDTIVVASLDGTTANVVVTINGLDEPAGNSPPVVSGPVVAGAAEDSGVLQVALLTNASDPNLDALNVAGLTGLVPGVTQNGNSLNVDTGAAAFQSLGAGVPQLIVVSYNVIDGKGGAVAQTALVTVTGVNDPAAITGNQSGAVTEDTDTSATGKLTASDPDADEAGFLPGQFAGSHGSLLLDEDGNWTYTLANASAAVQALDTGDTLPDTIVVASLDGATASIAITINGLDEPPPPEPAGSVAIGDVSVTEGDAGAVLASFTVTRSGGTAPFSVDFTTADDSATAANDDYGPDSGTLNFAAGETVQTITVSVSGDTDVEPDETFFVNLSNATGGATITDNQGLGTILNDDAPDPDPNVITGTDGRNFLRGTKGDDLIDARGGSDLVKAHSGDDTVLAGPGNDRVFGEKGDDEIFGGPGNDWLNGGKGDDALFGEEGNDWLFGGHGDDTLDGGPGRDKLSGGKGDDWLSGRECNDHLSGGHGDDHLYGGAGRDYLDGGKGRDFIDGGAGDDWLKGGKGADTFWFGPDFGNDVIADFRVRGRDHDVIAFDSDVFADWAELRCAIEETCGGVEITLDCDNTITILGVSKWQLFAHHDDVFQFV